MSTPEPRRQTHPDGRWELAAGNASFLYERLRPGTLLITVSGNDMGQFGTQALDEIRLEMLRHRPVELFVDAQGAGVISVQVSREWTQFFALNREQLLRVSVLVGSRAIELTVAIAQHLSQTGNLIQIYSDRELFDARVAAARRAQP
jgi:hypothetical protein